MPPDELESAYKHTSEHRAELFASAVCGCFYCLAMFPPTAITHWIGDKHGDTAICPECMIDSVLGDASGYPITAEFLTRMNARWFNA